jgi:hypothetical protein
LRPGSGLRPLPGIGPQRNHCHKERPAHPAGPTGQTPQRVPGGSGERRAGDYRRRRADFRIPTRQPRKPAGAGSPLPRKTNPHRKLPLWGGHQPQLGKNLPVAPVDRATQKRLLQSRCCKAARPFATQLETLPNIDINIKCGNSLVSRFALDADLGQALKKSKWTIDSYRMAVATYRNAENKEQKREMERLILMIKQDFATEIRLNNPIKKRLDKLSNELYHRFTGTFLFEPDLSYGKSEQKLKQLREKEKAKLEKEIEQLSSKLEEIRNNKIYNSSFEWRFEFPEVLNENGDFVGFDVVIGNPPYIKIISKHSLNSTLELPTFMFFLSKRGSIF